MKQPSAGKPSCAQTIKRRAPGASVIEMAGRCGSSCPQKRSWMIGPLISVVWCRDRGNRWCWPFVPSFMGAGLGVGKAGRGTTGRPLRRWSHLF
jgi:hypothetical protein